MTVNQPDELVKVVYLGQTKGGWSVLQLEGDENEAFVSNLKQANLRATNYLVKRGELWKSRHIMTTDGSGATWNFSSGRAKKDMTAAQFAETVAILKSIR